MENRRPARWSTSLAAVTLAYLVCTVFWPTLGFEFVIHDVYQQLIGNPFMQGVSFENLKHIFTSWSFTSYYPVRSLSLAADYHLWGLNPTGFKLTNGLIHLANVYLVLALCIRLLRHAPSADRAPRSWWQVSVATFAAGLFAVHPVVVEPVVWVAGREELLMTLGALGCVHFYITARRLGQAGGRILPMVACHAAAAFCCAAACLSNAVAAVIPLLIVAGDVLTLTRPKFRTVLYGTLPLWTIGAATIVVKKLGPEVVGPGELGAFSPQRIMLVLHTYWLNISTLLWPADLTISYERVSPKSLPGMEVILGGIAVGLACLLLWRLRRRKLILFGLVWFGLALGPTLQIIPHHVHRADRFLYLPLVGLAVAVAAALTPLGNTLKGRPAVAGTIVAGVSGLVLLGALSVRQVWTWESNLSVWEHCVSVGPNNPMARLALADALAEEGRFEQAMPHYQVLLRLAPQDIVALNNFALSLAMHEGGGLREYSLAIELAERGCRLSNWKDDRLLLTLAKAYNNFATERAESGEFGQAIHYYNKALHTAEYAPPLLNLASLLATCSDAKFRHGDRAVRLAERACQMVGQPDPHCLMVLAAAYGEAGRLDDAISTTEEAVRVAQATGNWQLAEELQRRLKLLRASANSSTGSLDKVDDSSFGPTGRPDQGTDPTKPTER